MHRTRLFRTARALVAIGLFTLSGTLRESGGDGFEENIFAPEHHVPESELQAYAMPTSSASWCPRTGASTMFLPTAP
ncbi:hypothetical protein LP419_05640 [Massilia sp. H-1]|nr:hypothetical protein LP419_05640 [Massilia sp. H-1]